MPAPSSFDDEVRALYRGPLADFVERRQALAKRLRLLGDSRAAEVKELRKPGLAAWAVNRLFAVEPGGLTALLGAGDRARAAQARGRPDDAARLRVALGEIRAGVMRLTETGVEMLAAGDRPPGEAIVERLRTNLEALALDPAAAAVAARGWLDDDLDAPGFEVLAALQVAAAVPLSRPPASARPAAAAQPPLPARQATVHQIDDARARRQREAQERKDRERRERIDRLAADAGRADAEAARLRRAAEEAVRAAESAADEAADAARRAEEARAAVAQAEARAARAEATAAKAREALQSVLVAAD